MVQVPYPPYPRAFCQAIGIFFPSRRDAAFYPSDMTDLGFSSGPKLQLAPLSDGNNTDSVELFWRCNILYTSSLVFTQKCAAFNHRGGWTVAKTSKVNRLPVDYRFRENWWKNLAYTVMKRFRTAILLFHRVVI